MVQGKYSYPALFLISPVFKFVFGTTLVVHLHGNFQHIPVPILYE